MEDDDLSRYSFGKNDPVAKRGQELARGLITAHLVDEAEDNSWPGETAWAAELKQAWRECIDGDERLALAVIASLSSLSAVLLDAASRYDERTPLEVMSAIAAVCEEIGFTY